MLHCAPPGRTEEQRTSWNFQRYAADYLRCVAGVDDSVGRMIEWLCAGSRG